MKLLYAFSFVFFLVGIAHGQIRMGGSDLLEPAFAEALEEYAETRGIELELDFSGSYPGINGLEKGTLDIAIIAVPMEGELPGQEYRAIHLATKVVTIAVPPSNPINQITMQQLAAIFGETESTNFTRWEHMGLTGEWAPRSIALSSVSQSEHMLTLDLFRHAVLQERSLKRNTTQSPDIEAIRSQFQRDDNGIALLHRVPENSSGMKILPIARTANDRAHAPTLETIANSDYPLRLPLYIVFRNDGAAQWKDLLRYLVSEEAAEALDASDLTPLPSQQRQRLFLEFERL